MRPSSQPWVSGCDDAGLIRQRNDRGRPGDGNPWNEIPALNQSWRGDSGGGTAVIRVRAVQVMKGYEVQVEFSDGTTRTVDLEPFLRGPVFEALRSNRELFRSVAVEDELGTLVWSNGADLDPEVLRGTRTTGWQEPDIDEAKRAVKQLGGLEPCERSRYRDVLRMIREAGAEIVPDVVAILRVVSDPEASDLLEGVASEFGSPYFWHIRALILDGSQEESFRLRLIRVMAWIAEVSEEVRMGAIQVWWHRVRLPCFQARTVVNLCAEPLQGFQVKWRSPLC